MPADVGDARPGLHPARHRRHRGGPPRLHALGVQGQPVVLVFYPGDNTPVCTRQLNAYTQDIDQFTALDAQVLAISPQSVVSHDAFSEDQGGFAFPLLADAEKRVGKLYGILGPVGFYRRSIFVVDAAGVLRHAHRAVAGLWFRPPPNSSTPSRPPADVTARPAATWATWRPTPPSGTPGRRRSCSWLAGRGQPRSRPGASSASPSGRSASCPGTDRLDGAAVVELGCGTGYVSAWLARRGARPVGIDPSPGQLAIARRMQGEHGLPFPLVRAAGRRCAARRGVRPGDQRVRCRHLGRPGAVGGGGRPAPPSRR